MDIFRRPACNFLSQYYFYNIIAQNFCWFSLQTLATVRDSENPKWCWIIAFDRRVSSVTERKIDRNNGLIFNGEMTHTHYKTKVWDWTRL